MDTLKPSYQGKTIKINGKNVYFIEAGGGEPLLMIHSWPTCNEIFHNLIPYLSKRYHIIAPDLPGFGLSEEIDNFTGINDYVNFLDTFLDHLDISKTNIFGVSMGGVISLKYLISNPKRIKKVIINASPLYTREIIPLWKLKLALFLSSSHLITNIVLCLMKTSLYCWYYTHIGSPDALEEEKLVKDIFNHARNASKKTVVKSIFGLIQIDLRNRLRDLEAPILFIIGENDDLQMKHQLEKFSREVKNTQLIVIPKGTHRLILNQADKLAGIISQFLSR